MDEEIARAIEVTKNYHKSKIDPSRQVGKLERMSHNRKNKITRKFKINQ